MEVTSDGNSWTINAKYLTSKQPLNITLSCIATKAANGVESQNVVSATADNFLSLDENPVSYTHLPFFRTSFLQPLSMLKYNHQIQHKQLILHAYVV